MQNYESNGYYQSNNSHDNGDYQDPNPDSQVRTLFIHGFPANVLDREVFNFIRTTCSGFDGRECLHILRKQNDQHPVTVFAKFKDRQHALDALERINNFDFDVDLPDRLRCYFAKSDLNQKNEVRRLPSSAKRNSDFQGNNYGNYGNYGGYGNYRNQQQQQHQQHQQHHHQQQRYSEPFSSSRSYGGDNNRPYYDTHNSGDVRQPQPCKTLFVGTACLEEELEGFFGGLSGFVRLKIGKPGSYAFVEFESVESAHAVLRTYDKHPVGNSFIRLSFARKDAQ
jgi:hypothetical protein